MTRARILADYVSSGDELALKAPLASPTFTGTPLTTTASAATNTTQIASTAYVRTEVTNLVDSAPAALDTLNELAAALGDDAAFSTTVTNSIATKLPLAGGTMTGNIVMGDDTSIGIADDAERIEFDGAGDISLLGCNVGIGIAAPEATLDILGNSGNAAHEVLRLVNNDPPASGETGQTVDLVFSVDDDGTGTPFFDVGRIRGFKSGDHYGAGADYQGGLSFWTEASQTLYERMRIDSSGNVGIGTTAPDAGLTIAGAESVGGILNLWADEGDDNADKWRVYAGTSGGLYSESYSSGAWVNKFTVLNSGNVGIGTSSPYAKLDVRGGTQNPGLNYNSTGYFSVGANVQMAFGSWESSPWAIWMQTRNATVNGSTYPLAINPLGGNVGIGTSSPASNLEVTGTSDPLFILSAASNAWACRVSNGGGSITNFYSNGSGLALSSGSWQDNSDERLKHDIEDIEYGLETVNNLKPRKFTWNENDREDIGFISQEVMSLIPEVVSEPNPLGMYNLTYQHLTAVLCKAIQELSAKVTALENA